ncbi:hypothetical protein LOC67_01720 [Stieleria sp. JC731]|uniref:dockerin type I domain-containing protein n=1 Tax=Pirellulaceae TaxID=2691357 RepID=UPI001E32E0AE|nr:dockerin type I domain-containing protein [Stieleria sp. JC731]MCC9599261.1 hypothetical protein [Stieleria sp. JC731]
MQLQNLETRRLMVAEVSVAVSSPESIAESPFQNLVYTFTRDETNDFLVVPFEISGSATFDVDYEVDELDRDTIRFPRDTSTETIVGAATFYPGESTVRLKVTPISDFLEERDEQIVISILESSEFGVTNGSAALIAEDEPTTYYLIDEVNRLGIVDIDTGIIDVLGTVDVPQVLNDIAILEDGTLVGITNDYLYDIQYESIDNGEVPYSFMGYHGIPNANALIDARDDDFDSEIGDLLAVGFGQLDLHRIDLDLVDDAWTFQTSMKVFDIDKTMASNGFRSDYVSSGDLDYNRGGDLILSAHGTLDEFDSLIEIETPADRGLIRKPATPAEDPGEPFLDIFGLAFDDDAAYAFAGHTVLSVNRFSLNSTREFEMTGRPFNQDGAQTATGTIIGDPVDPPFVGLNVGLTDPPSLPHGLMPTNWMVQRSDIRLIRIWLGASVANVSPTDMTLSNLGLSGVDIPTEIAISEDQIVLGANGKDLFIHFDHDELPDGRYSLTLSSQITSGPDFTYLGETFNRFLSIDGDFDGNRVVDIRDFATIAYWYGQSTAVAPAYVDLDNSGFIDQGDYSYFAANFGKHVSLPGAANPTLAAFLSAAELSRAENSASNIFDVNGNGVASPIDALNVINRLASGFPDNLDWRFDVNRDGQISPRDALRILNHLAASASSASGESELPTTPSGSFQAAISSLATDDDQSLRQTLADEAIGVLFGG